MNESPNVIRATKHLQSVYKCTYVHVRTMYGHTTEDLEKLGLELMYDRVDYFLGIRHRINGYRSGIKRKSKVKMNAKTAFLDGRRCHRPRDKPFRYRPSNPF